MTTTRLCVTVTAGSTAELLARRDAAAAAADLVELRLDGVADLDLRAALAGCRVPLIATCRPRWEGGLYDGPEEQRLACLEQAFRLGVDFVDVEWNAHADALVSLARGPRLILSCHDFAGVPGDLAWHCRAMREAGAGVVKLAGMAHSLSDTLPFLELGEREAASGPLVLVAMGSAGLPSRILAGRFGSCWTYAGDGAAPGQVSASRMLSEFRFRRLTADTRLYGVVGHPIEHSVSPAMHNAAFDAGGDDAVYLPLAAASAEDFLRFAAATSLAGASVTAPFKRDVASEALFDEDADGAGEAARILQAVNTLKAAGGAWYARNTDVAGFISPLDDRQVVLDRLRVSVIGTGGAARAVTLGLARRGARVTVHGRSLQAAGEAARRAGGLAGTDRPVGRGTWDLLVNATPVGTWPATEESPVDEATLEGGRLVYDLVYNPLRTRLMRDADRAGCTVIGGLDMLVAQAGAQFEWWTGRPAPRDVMRAAAERRLISMQTERAGE